MREIKNYLYINMDFLETFLAQQEDGLNVLSIHEGAKSVSKKRSSSAVTWEASIDGKLGTILAMLANIGGSTGVSVYSPQIVDEGMHISRNVHHKIQRENIFEKFLQYINLADDKFISALDETYVGKYVGLKTYVDFVSISRLEELSSSELQAFYSYFTDKDFSVDKVHEIKKQITHIKTLFPYDSFLTAEGVIVLMDDKHIRESKDQIGYKFNSDEIKVVGKVSKYTGQIRKRSAPMNQTLDDIQRFTFSIMRSLGIIRDNKNMEIFLITPVAIYA